MMNWKRYGMKWSWPILQHYPEFAWRVSKTTRNPSRVSLWAKIKTRDFLNAGMSTTSFLMNSKEEKMNIHFMVNSILDTHELSLLNKITLFHYSLYGISPLTHEGGHSCSWSYKDHRH
jgi:hypothetical protein